MGALLSSFTGRIDVTDVFVDFESAKYGDDTERQICEAADEILERAPGVIAALEAYANCGAQIRKALSDPNPKSEQEAFQAVKANVAIINMFFNFSKEVANMVRELLKTLATGQEKEAFCAHQFSVKQLGRLLDFVLRFDELKMLRPGIQNDFSYYRRVLPKHSNDPDLKVRDEEASFISLYIAQPIPMMTALAKSTSSLYVSNPNVPAALALMANVCLELLKSKRFTTSETNQLLVRVMVGSIVLFDHVSLEGGAFVKKSGINIKQAVQLVVKEYPTQNSLTNMLRYSTLHYSDDSTPAGIRSLLDVNK
ncbi:CYRIA/CYRIB Rac1 binding domain-containing protein [Plasmodiophora brassicae]|uniref:CYRIA/CYRIB Rac1 binding domain-containing protein n=1 Tax=Plasmodiophora brassicae TaxID=37360 RepID=A0A0G4IKW3_PLABS|nr:hypothetical protein PBRA_004440 [Plasmodiophora brassicae]SPQ99980.1 unnamed protein product [Plasmodiophora brassicae]